MNKQYAARTLSKKPTIPYESKLSTEVSLLRQTHFVGRLLSDALSCKVQIVNKIGLRFQQNRLKVNTNIVLYQVLF